MSEYGQAFAEMREAALRVKRERDAAVALLRESSAEICVLGAVCNENARCRACQHNNRVRAFLETLA